MKNHSISEDGYILVEIDFPLLRSFSFCIRSMWKWGIIRENFANYFSYQWLCFEVAFIGW